jgi:tetratricopeptide (TPR) repeat protein
VSDSTDSGGEGSPFRAFWPGAVLLVGAVLLAHFPALFRPFIWEDQVLREETIRRGWSGLFSADLFGFVRPGKSALFWLNETFFGRWLPGWQLGHLFLLISATLLTFQLAREFLSYRAALVTALVYAVHPLHVEGAFWVSAANGTWMTVCVLVYFLLMKRLTAGFSLGIQIGGLAALGTACLFKEEAVIVPGLVLGYGFLTGSLPRRTWFRLMLPHLVLVFVFLLFLTIQMGKNHRQLEVLPFPPAAMALMAPRAFLAHLTSFLWPFSWWYYDASLFRAAQRSFAWEASLGWVFLLLLGSLSWKNPRQRLALAPVWASLIAFLPVLNLVPLGNTPFGVRYLSLSAPFLALLFGRLLDSRETSLPARRPGGLFPALIGLWVVAAVWSSQTFHRIWAEPARFFHMVTTVNPHPRYLSNLVHALSAQGKHAEALSTIANGESRVRSLLNSLTPENPEIAVLNRIALDFRVSRAVSRHHLGQSEPAMAELREVLAAHPAHHDAAANLGFLAETRFAQTKAPEALAEAIHWYWVGLSGIGHNAEVSYQNLGFLLATNGRIPEAIPIWAEGLKRFPDSEIIRENLARAQRRLSASPTPD